MPLNITRMPALEPTVVFDSYWRFAAERQAIFFRRVEGHPAPWTDDTILRRHRFTNVYRAADRVSQFLIREVIYGEAQNMSPKEIVFRTLLFKLFNKIGTWKTLRSDIGELSWERFDIHRFDAACTKIMQSDQKLYSAAYIIPPVRWPDGDGVKHRGHLKLISHILRGDFADRIVGANSLESVFTLLKNLPSLGDFLAFQFAIDINYSPIVDFSEDSFVVAGPGARDGISKCFSNASSYKAEDIIRYMSDRQEIEFDRLGLNFKTLWGRRLQLIDCQNIFCEISKYARVAHPDVAGVSNRTRIKQIFRPISLTPPVWFPPKWGLNERLPRYALQSDLLL